jgi:hypothetical protein
MNATRTEATKDVYLTDPKILEVARRMRGSFALDPATNVNNPTFARIICVENPAAPWNPGVPVNAAFSVLENGLAQNWAVLADGGMIWINPPFGRAKLLFLAKAGNEFHRGAEIQMLIPCDPGTGWWQDYCSPRLSAARAVCHLRRRPQFYDPATGLPVIGKDGKPQGPQFSCNIVYWGEAADLFCETWSHLGDVDRGHR